MGIDQPGQYGGVGKIDQSVVRRRLDLRCRPDAYDLVAFDNDNLIGLHLAALHIQQLARTNNRALGRLLGRHWRKRRQQQKNRPYKP